MPWAVGPQGLGQGVAWAPGRRQGLHMLWGWGCGGRGARAWRPHLEVHVHQLVLPEDVVDLARLQPCGRLLLLPLEVDEDPQAALGVLERRSVGPEIRQGRSGQALPCGSSR